MVQAFKENVGTDGWSDEEISNLVDDLLQSSGNDFNAVLGEINKLKSDMKEEESSEISEEEENEIDEEERERLAQEARIEAAERKAKLLALEKEAEEKRQKGIDKKIIA